MSYAAFLSGRPSRHCRECLDETILDGVMNESAFVDFFPFCSHEPEVEQSTGHVQEEI